MSGAFKDSFTKEDTKEDVLGYDDTAFYYFVVSVLTCVALPWTIAFIDSFVRRGHDADSEYPRKSTEGSTLRYCKTAAMVEKVDKSRSDARKFTPTAAVSSLVQFIVLSIMWACIFGTMTQLGHEKEIQKFDPFVILDVPPSASGSAIKRAYRKFSLIYHPDKNPDDPLAASRFIQITKAYQALTDDIAKRNWEKYGNPDGPQTTKVGIGLPRFLLEKENHLMILCSFFFVIVFLVPITFICYYQNAKNFAANGAMIETLQFLGYYIGESARAKHGPELLAACAESRLMGTRPTDNADIKKLGGHVIEHKKRVFTFPAVMKNQYLTWAHMQRRHSLMTPPLRKDLDELLGHSMKVTQAMIEVACMREWFGTAQGMIEFRRCLVQGLDIKSSQLLQIPHFSDKEVDLFQKASPPVTTLSEFLALEPDERKKLSQLGDTELLDVEAFCGHIGKTLIKAHIGVEDESEIIVGDVATVKVQMCRKHLASDEALGPVSAPLFPGAKFEEWWLFLVDSGAKERIVHFERVLDLERCLEEKLRFQVTKAGENKLVLYAMCDAYAGMDHRIELTFTAYAEDEMMRKMPVHQEDEDLDLQPTLFQQWMGDFKGDESTLSVKRRRMGKGNVEDSVVVLATDQRLNWMHATHFFTVAEVSAVMFDHIRHLGSCCHFHAQGRRLVRICDAMAGYERGAPSQVVQNSLQARLDQKEIPKWICDCGAANLSTWSHCTKCSKPRPEDREMRMQARAVQGLGRGGGYFERTTTEQRGCEDLRKVKGGLDIYGRTRTDSPKLSPSTPPSTGPADGPRNSLAPVGTLPTKTDRQKAALERLRAPKKKRDDLSPPRTRVYREKSSRSRSIERRRESRLRMLDRPTTKAGMFRTKTFQDGGYHYFLRLDIDLFFVEAPVLDPFQHMADHGCVMVYDRLSREAPGCFDDFNHRCQEFLDMIEYDGQPDGDILQVGYGPAAAGGQWTIGDVRLFTSPPYLQFADYFASGIYTHRWADQLILLRGAALFGPRVELGQARGCRDDHKDDVDTDAILRVQELVGRNVKLLQMQELISDATSESFAEGDV
ncbi:ERDJ2B, partial [Symbiodinium sp. KB8]